MIGLLVAVTAGLGAVARYLVDQVVQHRTQGEFPYGTVVINTSGSFLLGLLLGLAAHHRLDRQVSVVLGTGFAGGFTTLSTWAWETLALAELGRFRAAVANLLVSFAAGLAAAGVGFGIALLV